MLKCLHSIHQQKSLISVEFCGLICRKHRIACFPTPGTAPKLRIFVVITQTKRGDSCWRHRGHGNCGYSYKWQLFFWAAKIHCHFTALIAAEKSQNPPSPKGSILGSYKRVSTVCKTGSPGLRMLSARSWISGIFILNVPIQKILVTKKEWNMACAPELVVHETVLLRSNGFSLPSCSGSIDTNTEDIKTLFKNCHWFGQICTVVR